MSAGAPSKTDRRSRHWDAVVLILTFACAIGAHLTIHTKRSFGQWFGNVLVLDAWQRSTYEGENIEVKPSLVLLGDSQIQVVVPPKPNGPFGDGFGNTVLDFLAADLDRRHPATPARTYVRLSGAAFTTLDYIVTMGLWLDRAEHPVPILIPLDINITSQAPHLHARTSETIEKYPEAAKRVLHEIMAFPEGPEAVEVAEADIATYRSRLPNFINSVEHDLTYWLKSKKYFYGEAASTTVAPTLVYSQIEAVLLQATFGRVNQTLPPRTRRSGKEFRFVKTLMGLLKAHGMTPICYIEPRHPTLYPRTPADDALAERLSKAGTEAGCVAVFDTRRAVEATEDFGYVLGTPDTHLTEAGHRALAASLGEEGERAGVWSSALAPH